MNEEFEEGGRHLIVLRDLENVSSWQHFTLSRFFCCKGDLANVYPLMYPDLFSFSLSRFLSVFFKTCLLNITRFYFFITTTTIVKVIEEFLFLGCCNFHHSFARLYKGDVLLLSLGAQGVWLHSRDEEFIKQNLCGALWNQLINCSPQ